VEHQIVLVLVQIVEANGTFEPMLDSRKSDRADGAIIVPASRWPDLLVFLIIVVLLLGCPHLGRLLLGHLLPQERDKPYHHDFVVPEILQVIFPILESSLLTCEYKYIYIYIWLHLVIKMEINKNKSMT
jgi:hypothetical protein